MRSPCNSEVHSTLLCGQVLTISCSLYRQDSAYSSSSQYFVIGVDYSARSEKVKRFSEVWTKDRTMGIEKASKKINFYDEALFWIRKVVENQVYSFRGFSVSFCPNLCLSIGLSSKNLGIGYYLQRKYCGSHLESAHCVRYQVWIPWLPPSHLQIHPFQPDSSHLRFHK